MWELDYKESWVWKNYAFELWCWRRLLRLPWTARRSSQSILKEIGPAYSLEGLMLELKLQYFGHLMQRFWLIWKDPDDGKDWEQEEKGTTEDEMVGWHHRHNGHGFGCTQGVGDGQGGLACCGSWVCKESNMTEWLNWTEHEMLFNLTNYQSNENQNHKEIPPPTCYGHHQEDKVSVCEDVEKKTLAHCW